MVEERPFVVIHRFGRRLPREQMLAEFEHIVSVAGLRGFRRQVLGKLRHREEVLVIAMPADDVGAVDRHLAPEGAREVAISRVAREFIFPRRADDFGNLGVGVQPGQRVLALGQWIEQGMVIERLGHP